MLVVKPLKGYLTHNTNYFTSMDPYCYIYFGKQSQKTTPHYGGGIRPMWRDVMKFALENITKLGIQIWTKSLIGSDTLIAQGLIDLKKLNLKNKEPKQEYVDVLFENKPAGRVLLEIQYVSAQDVKTNNQANHNVAKQNVKGEQRKVQRKSWAGEVNWRGSDISDKAQPYQPPSSAIYQNQKSKQKRLNSPIYNPSILNQADMLNFKKKTADMQRPSQEKHKTQQEKANQYLNQQVLKNFVPRQSNTGSNPNLPPFPKQQQNHDVYSQQQMIQQQMMQQYPFLQSPFQNLNNNINVHKGLTVGTVYAQPDKNYNPHRKSNLGRGSNANNEMTPPKSILTPNKHDKGKSPGKKVHFADQHA